MADYWTLARLRTKIERDLDLEDELFITDDEMTGYINEAIAEVSRQIHSLYEDYFIKRGTITLVQGQEEYDLPTDIYAMKIRSIVYRNGTTVWKLKRIRDWNKFENYEIDQTGYSDYNRYGFFVVNSTAGSPKIVLAPTPNEAGAYLKIWYIRNANTLVLDSDVCDIPEAVNYIIQYVKVRCYEKEGNPMLEKAMADLAKEEETTLGVLASMVPDNENEIEPDFRLYEDMV